MIIIVIIIIDVQNDLFTMTMMTSLMVFRSKELRESLSRPSSRLSCENGMEKMGKDVVRLIIIITMVMKMIALFLYDHLDQTGNDQGRGDI